MVCCNLSVSISVVNIFGTVVVHMNRSINIYNSMDGIFNNNISLLKLDKNVLKCTIWSPGYDLFYQNRII